MKKPDFPKYCQIELSAGDAFFPKKTHSSLNPRFFAELYLSLQVIRHYSTLGFMVWDNYKWRCLDEHLLLNTLEKLIEKVAWDYDVERVDFSEATLYEILKILKRKAGYGNLPPAIAPDIIPLENTLLRWHPEMMYFEAEQYSPDIIINERMPVKYNPAEKSPQFNKVIEEILPDTEDRRVIQEYLGAAFFPVNRSRKFLLLYGDGGCGKSVLVLFLIGLLGASRVFDLNIENIKSGYELSALNNQTLLTASEAVSKALCTDGAEWVKKAVGGDFFQTRKKFCNEKTDHYGTFSLIIVSNNQLRFQFEGNGHEWADRLIPIFFGRHIPEERKDRRLVERLLQEEKSGIFNWFLEGAKRIRQNNWEIVLSPTQKSRIEYVLARSKPMQVFVKNYVVESAGESFASADAFRVYAAIHHNAGFPPLGEQAFYKQLSQAMQETYGAVSNNSSKGKCGRGYIGFKLIEN